MFTSHKLVYNPWSWTSESGFDSDHDLTTVLALHRYLSRRELGNVAMTSRIVLDLLTSGAWWTMNVHRKGWSAGCLACGFQERPEAGEQ